MILRLKIVPVVRVAGGLQKQKNGRECRAEKITALYIKRGVENLSQSLHFF